MRRLPILRGWRRRLRLRRWRRPFIVTRHWGPRDAGQIVSRHRTAWLAWQAAELYRENQANWDAAIMRGGYVKPLFPVVFKVTDTRAAHGPMQPRWELGADGANWGTSHHA